jgi:pyruvate,water dikinase
MRRLSELANRVAGQLIPQLEAQGERFAAEAIESYDDSALAAAIVERRQALEYWRQIYLDDFIPFAHGVRQLGTYYNDAVQPQDPYEFVSLLKGEQMVAARRNHALALLAHRVRRDPALANALGRAAKIVSRQADQSWQQIIASQLDQDDAQELVAEIEALIEGFLDVAYGGQRLSDRPDLVFNTVLEMASDEEPRGEAHTLSREPAVSPKALEQKLLRAIGPARHEEAQQVLAIGRLSWRLRDDDNLLVGRLESQLLRALNLAADRLRKGGRLEAGVTVQLAHGPALEEALRDDQGGTVELAQEPEPRKTETGGAGESPRQLVGQPAGPGLASGRVCVVRGADDLGRFRAGEVLVCDAIQPNMTHLVPLASAIVERRGGMLIHGAIIAREMGIPCVNGVTRAAEWLSDGDLVTVDGYLGIVTVGPPEFELELREVEA